MGNAVIIFCGSKAEADNVQSQLKTPEGGGFTAVTSPVEASAVVLGTSNFTVSNLPPPIVHAGGSVWFVTGSK